MMLAIDGMTLESVHKTQNVHTFVKTKIPQQQNEIEIEIEIIKSVNDEIIF